MARICFTTQSGNPVDKEMDLCVSAVYSKGGDGHLSISLAETATDHGVGLLDGHKAFLIRLTENEMHDLVNAIRTHYPALTTDKDRT